MALFSFLSMSTVKVETTTSWTSFTPTSSLPTNPLEHIETIFTNEEYLYLTMIVSALIACYWTFKKQV